MEREFIEAARRIAERLQQLTKMLEEAGLIPKKAGSGS